MQQQEVQSSAINLTELGFSNYELAAFTVLSKAGTATARDVSKAANVPFGRIYDVLYGMHERGVVSVIPSRPILFKAMPAEQAFSKIVDAQSSQLNKFREQIKNIAKEFEKTSAPISGKPTEDIDVFFGREAFYGNAISRLKETRLPISIIASNYSNKALAYACCNYLYNKKQKLRLLVKDVTDENRENLKNIIKMKGEVRLYNSDGLRMLVEDGELVSITIPAPENHEDRITIQIKNHLFALAMENFFTMAWKDAKSVKIQ